METILDEDGNPLSNDEIFRRSEEYAQIRKEMKLLQPMRIGVFKRYWDKFKYNRRRREHLVEMFDKTDE